MARPLLLFDRFVPRDAESRDAQLPFIATTGVSEGVQVPVLLCDIGHAERWAKTTAAILEPLLGEKPERARVPWSAEDPAGTLALVAALLEQEDLAIDVVTLNGTASHELPLSDRVRVFRAGELERIILSQDGPTVRELLAHGVVWQDEPSLICDRPQRMSLAENGPEQLLGALEQHLAACQVAYPAGIPSEALELRIEGTRAFDDPIALRRVLDVASVRGVLLCAIRYRGRGNASGLLVALREVVGRTLRGARVEMQIEPSEDPLVDLGRTILGENPLDPERLIELHRAWSEEASGEERVRFADDLLRRTVFHAIRKSDPSEGLLERAAALLGPSPQWIDTYHRFEQRGPPGLAVVPTWQCELRCTYCTIPKQDGRVMSERTLERAIELLLSSDSRELELHFVGGEPFVEWPLVRHACEWGSLRASELDAKIKFVFTTNAFSLTREMVECLSEYDVRFQLSIDGDASTQNAFRRTLTPGLDSHERSAAGHAAWFRDTGVEHHLIQVVHPNNVERMDLNFVHLMEQGYEKIKLSFALGARWSHDAVVLFGEGLDRIGAELERRWDTGQPGDLVNLLEDPTSARRPVEVTVDHDGHVFGGGAFLYIPKLRPELLLGHLDDLRSFDRYSLDELCADDLLRHWYTDGLADNNRQVATAITRFVRSMWSRHPERFGEHRVAEEPR
jgi:hypothetical protein